MKLKSLLQSGLLCAFEIGSAHANPFTVYLQAHVTAVNDPVGELASIAGAPVTVGQAASGQYRYDTSTPDMNAPDAPDGFYSPAPGQGGFRISIGSLVFQSESQSGSFTIGVHRGAPAFPGGPQLGEIRLESWPNLNTPNIHVQHILVDFQDPYGNAPSSTALPTDIPDLTAFTTSTVTVTGNEMNDQGMGGDFSVTFVIDNVYVFPPSSATWSVSPATSVFSRQQNIDAVVLLPAGSQVQSVQTFVGGVPGPFGFGPIPPPPVLPGGQCSVQPQNSKGQQVIQCSNVLPLLRNGMNQIDWQVQLMDGTTLDKVVVWDVIP